MPEAALRLSRFGSIAEHTAGERNHSCEPSEHWSGQLPERVPLGGHALHFAVLAELPTDFVNG